MTIQSGQPIATGSYIQFQFPTELGLPEAVNCGLISLTLESIACSQSVSCAYKGSGSQADFIQIPTGLVKSIFTFVTSPLPANTPFAFIISGIGNPASTKPIKIVNVSLYDSSGNLVPEPSAQIPSFSMKIPATILSSTLTLDNY